MSVGIALLLGITIGVVFTEVWHWVIEVIEIAREEDE